MVNECDGIRRKVWVCTANCPELDFEKLKHCTFSEHDLENPRFDNGICPVGNYTKLEKIQ